jgi:hypothetical protein
VVQPTFEPPCCAKGEADKTSLQQPLILASDKTHAGYLR